MSASNSKRRKAKKEYLRITTGYVTWKSPEWCRQYDQTISLTRKEDASSQENSGQEAPSQKGGDADSH